VLKIVTADTFQNVIIEWVCELFAKFSVNTFFTSHLATAFLFNIPPYSSPVAIVSCIAFYKQFKIHFCCLFQCVAKTGAEPIVVAMNASLFAKTVNVGYFFPCFFSGNSHNHSPFGGCGIIFAPQCGQ
jgi:hypothetical protein